MIDESLLKSNFLGRDGFVWWVGRVAHPKYWRKENLIMAQNNDLGQRCKVRIVGYHPFSNELPEQDLPWAQVMMDPVTGSGQGGLGDSLCLVGGETCVGFFMDGEEAQQPVIIGVLNRSNNVKKSLSDEEIIQGGSSQFQPFDYVPNLSKPTKVDKVKTKPITQNSPATQGQIETTEAVSAGVVQNKGDGTLASFAVEKGATKTLTKPGNCSNDLIGRITQVLTDFISLTNSLESSLGKFIDPIRNKAVDMGQKIKKLARQVQGLVKQVINNIRDGLIGKITSAFSIFLGKLNLLNPFEFITDAIESRAFKKILDTLYCIFEKLIQDLLGFLINMFETMVGRIINGPVCAAEQFVSGIFAKVFDMLDKLLSKLFSGLDWLVGGFDTVRGVLKDVSGLASAIFSFIGCDEKKCSTPSQWVTDINASVEKDADNWENAIKGINIFEDAAAGLTGISSSIKSGISSFFGNTDPSTVGIGTLIPEYNGMRISSILSATDRLTGGDSAGALDRGLGSIESAIATSTLFGGTNSVFDACNRNINNPRNQDDVIRMPLGYQFGKCLPPEIKILGNGSGAEVRVVVAFGQLTSVEIVNRGSGYDADTNVAVIENTRCGKGGQLKAIINDDDGGIDNIVITDPGGGYVPDPNTGSNVDSTSLLDDIFVENPGIGYTGGDTVIIGGDGDGVDGDGPSVIIGSPLTTPNGSIVGVTLPNDTGVYEFDVRPNITINTNNGRGASLIPVLRYKPLSSNDPLDDISGDDRIVDDSLRGRKRSTLVGITSVIDCI